MLNTVDQNHFQQHRRESLLDYDVYRDVVDDRVMRIDRTARNMADPAWMKDKDPGARMRMTEARAEYFVEVLELNYSAGDSLLNLRSYYPAAVEAWETFDHCTRHFDTQTEEGRLSDVGNFSLRSEEFALVNRMVSMAILLGWHQLLSRIVPVVMYRNPSDAMLEKIFQFYGCIDKCTTSECTRHLPYFKTLKIFSASKPEQPALVKDYLADWYHASRREAYYDSHKHGDSFRGYWAWEAAAITVILDIDDSSYRNDKFYPADAVAFARQCQQDYTPAGLPPSSKTN